MCHEAKVEERDMHTTLAPLYQDSGHHCKAITEELSSPEEDRIGVWKVLQLSSFGSLVYRVLHNPRDGCACKLGKVTSERSQVSFTQCLGFIKLREE